MTAARRPADLSDKSGFALPMVLALVTVLALIFAVALVALRSLGEETRTSLNDVEFRRAAMTAEARVQYLMVSQPFGPQGLRIGGIRAPNARSQQSYQDYVTLFDLADRPYRWLETPDQADGRDYLASLQDEAGLVNLYQADPGMVSRLFQTAGLSADNAELLASELLEYNQLPAPKESMRRLAELYSLPSARDLISDRAWNKIGEIATVHPDSTAININTAPAEVLKIWFDIPDQQAEQAIADRERFPLATPADIGVTVLNANAPYAASGGRLRFTFTDLRTGQTYRSTIVLTPTNITRPLWVENPRIQHLAPPSEPDDEPEDFPEIPDSTP